MPKLDYKTPNVYVQEIQTLPPSVAPVATAIPAFIGYTEKADYLNKPIRISSLLEYTTIFGGAQPTEFTVTLDAEGKQISGIPRKTREAELPEYLMYYALRLFFQNEGGSCYVVSIGKYSDQPNKNKEDFEKGLDAISTEDEPTLILLPDAVRLQANDYYTLCQAVLKQCNDLKDRFAIFDVLSSDRNPTDGIGNGFRNGIGTENLKYGAAYYPYLQTSLNYHYTDESVKLVTTAASSKESPNANNPLSAIKTTKTELYNAIQTALKGIRVVMPPSSAVAGAYAKVDRERGVWKAPANIGLSGVIEPTVKITNEQQEALNVDSTAGKSINAIRSFTGKGTLIWGARTLVGNDNEWRYISVRRLFNLIEESIQKATSFVVFESNNAIAWLKVKTLIETYLEGLWRQGAMAGASQNEAYFVSVGLGQTMTEQDILEGRMIIKIGISAVRPAEFIVLQFSHKLQQA